MRMFMLALLLTTGCRAGETPAPVEGDAAAATKAAPAAPEPDAAEVATASPAGEAGKATSAATPCLVQNGRPLGVAAFRAIGTEPFWGAQTDGRCVTYSTPEDQTGTRIWTKVQTDGGGPVWTGALRGKIFQLSVRPLADCSDGMSDNRYPLEAKLLVDGEERRGCAREIASGR